MNQMYTLKRQPDSVAKVSHWVIPGGADYDQAFVIEKFFADMAKAEDYAKKYSMPPEMALLISL